MCWLSTLLENRLASRLCIPGSLKITEVRMWTERNYQLEAKCKIRFGNWIANDWNLSFKIGDSIADMEKWRRNRKRFHRKRRNRKSVQFKRKFLKVWNWKYGWRNYDLVDLHKNSWCDYQVSASGKPMKEGWFDRCLVWLRFNALCTMALPFENKDKIDENKIFQLIYCWKSRSNTWLVLYFTCYSYWVLIKL
jgi:hypothetical protein